MIYWKQLKNGNLRIQKREPKRGVFVLEQSEEVKSDFQHYIHTFTLFRNQTVVAISKLHTFNGYDRGPKRERVVATLLSVGEAQHA